MSEEDGMKRLIITFFVLGTVCCLFGCQKNEDEKSLQTSFEEEIFEEEISDNIENIEEEAKTWQLDAKVNEVWSISEDFINGNSGDIKSLNDWINALRPFREDNLFAKEVVDRFEMDNISNMTDMEKDFISGYIQTLLYADLVDYSKMKVHFAYAAGYSEDGSCSSEMEYNYRGIFLYVKDTVTKGNYDYSNMFVNIFSFEDNSVNPDGVERHGVLNNSASKMPKDYGISLESTEGEIVGEGNKHIVGLHYFSVDVSQFNDILTNSSLVEFVKEFRSEIVFPMQNAKIQEREKAKEDNKPKEPSIGMTEQEVLNSSWGSPKRKNIDTYEWGTKEQWVYSRGYIYFENGVVTTISER